MAVMCCRRADVPWAAGGRFIPVAHDRRRFKMLDAIIRQAAERFGLGDNARPFVGQLLALIFNPAAGGISGFLQKFRDAGLGSVASSWVGGSPGDNELQPDQVHAVLGSDTISSLAGKIGVPASAISLATAGLLPRIVAALTPGGQLPDSIPSGLASLIPGAGPGAGIGGAAAAVGNASRETASSLGRGASVVGAAAASTSATAGGGLGFLKWLIPLAIVLALGYCMWSKRGQAPVASTTPAAEVASPAEPVAVAPAPSAEPAAPEPVVETAPAPTADAALMPCRPATSRPMTWSRRST
ncbi:DUF937 domain-containing protein [Pseudoxanthomonas gei]|uniref:DUF937 domain-containing protein n=2 Tax=Pseudoxanthomonas gei TaxID=1383030 RepID=A0ABX0AC50_9GAMM|nr:DUF937 domain-containing protein [Pseudoxanthomonas gei]